MVTTSRSVLQKTLGECREENVTVSGAITVTNSWLYGLSNMIGFLGVLYAVGILLLLLWASSPFAWLTLDVIAMPGSILAQLVCGQWDIEADPPSGLVPLLYVSGVINVCIFYALYRYLRKLSVRSLHAS
jgi:hypothetical protein